MNTSTIHVGITDHLNPEVQAMVQAMYSRNSDPIISRIPDSEESTLQHKEKLGKFYTGYGHKSIGQIGSTTVWFENVSLLAEKAIQNHPLYNGQACSTRYIDFSTQPMYSPDDEITKWQETFRAFYIKALPLTIEKIKQEYPFDKDAFILKLSHQEASKSHPDTINVFIDDKLKYTINHDQLNSKQWYFIEPLDGNSNFKDIEYNTFESAVESIKTLEFTKKINSATTIWENTVKARAFDICRGILPAGVTTNVAFTGTFDTLNDHLGEMLFHPCKEMRNISIDTLTKLKQVYPYATKNIDKLKQEFSYVNKTYFYQDITKLEYNTFFSELGNLDWKNRKKFEKLSRFVSGEFKTNHTQSLDYGSFRDLQRHRNGYLNMPVLDVSLGFHDFYKYNLPNDLITELSILLSNYDNWYLQTTYLSDVDKQYCTPIGYKVKIDYSCDLNQMLYMFELRSGKTSHQTLRSWIHSWILRFEKTCPNVKLHVDMDEDNFTLRRGKQTFIKS